VLIYPIVNSLIPIVSSSKAVGDEKKAERMMNVALRLSAVIALPCAFGLATLSEPILKLIFENAASAEMAAPLLTTLAPSIFLIGVMAVSNGILQACGMQKYTLISMPAGAAVKAILAYLLPSLTVGGAQLRMYAAPISTFAFYLTVTAVNFFFIVKYTSLRISVVKIYLRPFIASVICAVCAAGGYILLRGIADEKLSVLIAIASAATVYAVTLLLLGAITREEIEMLPLGKKLTPVLTALKLIR
jgi:stage V sporulation protein B